MTNTPEEYTPESLREENARRCAALKANYDPVRGIGACGERCSMTITNAPESITEVCVPVAMTTDADFSSSMTWDDHARLRIRYDFEFWCVECVTIKDKITSRNIAFRLNAPQRRVLATLEAMRIAEIPIRLIMLKARQWGGSTLVQIYMAWMQIVLLRQWNSLICGHLKDTSASIKGMYSRLLRHYPSRYLPADSESPTFRAFEKSRNVSEITTRDCLVAIGSAESQEAIRGYDIAMAHLTEVAFWRTTAQKSPESLIRSVCGSVAMVPNSIVVLESTANGVGNYFHTEWLRSKAGLSDKVAVFVPWYEIEIYRRPVKDAWQLWQQLDDYERRLWDEGLTLEMLHWYHTKRREYSSHSLMKAEYPSNDIEAFTLSGRMVFDAVMLERMRRECIPPRFVGELEGDAVSGRESLAGIHLVESDAGHLKVWTKPDTTSEEVRSRYLAVVDVGGAGHSADFSVIAVIDRLSALGKPEVVAQWRGHIDYNHLAWKAAQVARWYNNALLIIESNTLETHGTNVGGVYILDIIAQCYRNLYRRSRQGSKSTSAYGFHTNTTTKPCAIYELIRQIRDSLYIERDDDAIDEMSWFEMKSASQYGAVDGRHDDIVITRAIAFYVLIEQFSRRTAPFSTTDLSTLTEHYHI